MSCRALRFDGADSDFMYFSTASRTRKKLRHTLTVDKRSGICRCSCEDAVCRKKKGDVLDPNALEVCAHQKALLEAFSRIINEGIETAVAA
jgi:hypothetical protein